jgi:polyphosphate kinase 2 (PPK2 family)
MCRSTNCFSPQSGRIHRTARRPSRNSMKKNEIIERSRKFAEPYCVTNSKKFRLKDVDPGDTGEATSEDKPRAKELLETGIQALAELQDVLYAQDRWSVLLIFQAMDAAGKDGAIKHVMSGVNPQGCQVYSFKSPSAEDLNHDYLWRCLKCLPERGRIGIFNRSYYEETLVVRVHPELLAKQKIPQQLVTKDIWDERYRDIRHFQHYLTRNGSSFESFFCTSLPTNRRNASLSGWIIQRKTGRFPLRTPAGAAFGRNTWKPTRI